MAGLHKKILHLCFILHKEKFCKISLQKVNKNEVEENRENVLSKVLAQKRSSYTSFSGLFKTG